MATESAPETAKTAQARAKQRQVRKRRTTARAPQASTSRKRKFSTPAERAKIIAVAEREGLTAQQVQKRFGVKPVTYYSWRKASKKSAPRAKGAPGQRNGQMDLAGQIRQALRAQIDAMLPAIIRDEVRAAIGGSTAKR